MRQPVLYKDTRFLHTGKPLPLVTSFSGGRSSGRMLREQLDRGEKPIVLFANTGKERDETLDFVHEVETRWGIPIVWLEYACLKTPPPNALDRLKTRRMKLYWMQQPYFHWFKIVNYETAARHHQPGPFDELLEWMSVLPNVRARSCTAQLKIRTMQRYLWSLGVYSFVNAIGYRADEPERAFELMAERGRDKDIGFSFPLMELGIEEPDIRQWWVSQPFDLRLESYEGNCHLCFMKRKGNKIRLMQEQPQYTGWWDEWERRKTSEGYGAGGYWNGSHSIESLQRMAIPLVDEGPESCDCTSGVSLATQYGDEE